MSNKYENEEVGSSMGGGFTLAPNGNHLAICIGVALLGTIEQSFNNVVSRKKMVRLYFELSNTVNEEDEGRPFIVGQDYLNSLNGKANLRKLLEGGWGKITDAQAETFNLVKLLGHSCMANVAIATSKKGSQYNDIIGLSPIPDSVPAPIQKTEEFLFNFNPPFKQIEFEKLEPFVQAKIKSSDEYIALVGGHAPQQQAAPAAASNVPFAQQATPQAQTGTPKSRPFN